MSLSAILQAVERVLLTLWVGGLWVTGLVVVPVLFRNYERMVAGDIAGRLFAAMSWLGMLCGALLLAFAWCVPGSGYGATGVPECWWSCSSSPLLASSGWRRACANSRN